MSSAALAHWHAILRLRARLSAAGLVLLVDAVIVKRSDYQIKKALNQDTFMILEVRRMFKRRQGDKEKGGQGERARCASLGERGN
jgi:hypothetical protein